MCLSRSVEDESEARVQLGRELGTKAPCLVFLFPLNRFISPVTHALAPVSQQEKMEGEPTAASSRRQSRTPSKSAAAVFGVARARSNSERARGAASATAYRTPITPPVCGVSPGRCLQLQTSLGLMKARDLLEHEARSHANHMHQQQQLSTMSQPNRGTLKSGRLQPLGVVDVPLLQPDNCLGIISSEDRREYNGRSRSSTSPAGSTHWEGVGGRGGRREMSAVDWRRKRMPRSYSAVARSFDSSELSYSASFSKQVNLTSKEVCDESTLILSEEMMRTNYNPVLHPNNLLPPVNQQSQKKASNSPIRVEVRGVRKVEVSPSQNQADEHQENVKQVGLIFSKLPEISSSSSSPTRVQVQQLQSRLSENGGKCDVNSTNSEVSNERELLKKQEEVSSETKVGVAAFGKVVAVGDERKSGRSSQTKRHRTRSSENRLSSGWSQPRPLDPILRGHTMNTSAVTTRTNRTNRGNIGAQKSVTQIGPRVQGTKNRVNFKDSDEISEDSVDRKELSSRTNEGVFVDKTCRNT